MTEPTRHDEGPINPAWLIVIIGLIVAGEAVFALPFHITRFFRPTVLDVFGLTNTELGTVQAAYGIVAMLAANVIHIFGRAETVDRDALARLVAVYVMSPPVVPRDEVGIGPIDGFPDSQE